MKKLYFTILLISFSVCLVAQTSNLPTLLNENSSEILVLPKNTDDQPAAGKRVSIRPKRFSTGNVHHMLYLPKNWNKNFKESGERWPIIFEYTGNYHSPTGSSGKIEDAGLGYSLSGGKYIWVTLPYVSNGGKTIPLKWWGNTKATVAYAKKYVPEIIEEFGGDTNAVFLCGFSRGAIGVNYLGLHDDEIAKLWSGFITHDHFDGVKQWAYTEWGYPLSKYRKEAEKRLKRVNGRPFLVIQNGEEYGTEKFVTSVLENTNNFKFLRINTNDILGDFPNEIAMHEHTDKWALAPGKSRVETRTWMNDLVTKSIEKQVFEALEKLDWNEAFYDSCTKRWKKNWSIDGEKAKISNSIKGMDFMAGPHRKEDASHAVLWTKESFAGDVKIEYEYTKIEDVIEAVNILYIQATGSCEKGYEKDISLWAKKRKVAAMRQYFNHMNTFHISYAAFDIGNLDKGKDYIRARRYIPEQKGLTNTDLKPDYLKTALFEKDIPHKITIIKKDEHLFMQIKNEEQTYLCYWLTKQVPEITEGRIGIRHMWTRGARYKDFRVSTLK